MAIFYLDTSAILKRYRTEKGTDVVDELYDSQSPTDLLLTSHFSCLEFESVAARALKGRLLSQDAYDAMLGSFSSDLRKYIRLREVSGAGVNGAIALSRRYALRAADAIQAASAADVATSPPRDAMFLSGVGIVVPGGGFVFVSSDKELVAATKASGMTTLDPESENAMEELRKIRA
jgi:predicted nucleic acid-binding protein